MQELEEKYLKLVSGCGIDSRYFNMSFKDMKDCKAKNDLLNILKRDNLINLLSSGKNISIQGETGMEESFSQLTARALALNELPVRVVHISDLVNEYLLEDLLDTQILVILSYYDSSYEANPIDSDRFMVETFLNKYSNKKKSLILHCNGIYDMSNKWWSKSLSYKLFNNCVDVIL